MAFGGDEIRNVVFRFLGDSKDLSGESKKAAGSLDQVSGSSKKTSGALAKIGPAAKAAGAAAAVMAAKWAVDGIEMAQTAELVGLSYEKTFGQAGDEVLTNLEAQRQAMGLSEAEFQKLITAMGAVNIGMHQSQDEAAQFATEMVTVAADVAAFNGEMDQAPHVLEAINGALIGNTESLEAYGIEVTAAMVEQRALADSGKETASELTDLEKRLAAQALITEKATLMTGSLNDAMDMGATKQNEFNAKMKDAQTEVGRALMPLKELVFDVLLALVPILDALAPLMRILGDLIARLVPILDPVIRAIDYFAIGLKGIIDFISTLLGWIGNLGNSLITLGNRIRSTFSFTPPSWMRSLGFFHSGGTVPGPTGQSKLAVVQGGEEIRTASQARSDAGGHSGGGAGMVVNVTINAGVGDPLEIGRQVSDVLTQYAQQTGPLDLPTRQAVG